MLKILRQIQENNLTGTTRRKKNRYSDHSTQRNRQRTRE